METAERVEMEMENSSGVLPVEYKVVVLPDPVEEKIGSIHVPDSVKDKLRHRTIKGTFIAGGGNAFEGWNDPVPEPGDRVYIAVGAGIIHEGPDGKEYRLANDKDIVGILVQE